MDELEAVESISTPLPPDMHRENSCCFTGHRRIHDDLKPRLDMLLDEVINSLTDKGVRYFICGGAFGFDMMAEQAVVRAIIHDADIKLILALPCVNQTEKWKTDTREGMDAVREYQRIKGYAYSIRYVSANESYNCMKKRNQYMVDHAGCLIAYCALNHRRSGSVQTFRMAQKAGIAIVNLMDYMT